MEKLKNKVTFVTFVTYLVLFLISFISVEFGLPWGLLGLLVLGYSQHLKTRVWHHYTITSLMIAYLAWLIFALQFSQMPSVSIIVFLILASLPITYLVASNQVNFNETWKLLRVVLLGLGAIFGLWGIWQVYRHVGRGYAEGPLMDRNAFAALLNLLWFPAIYMFLAANNNANKWTCALITICLLIINTALFATTSRAGIGVWVLFFPLVLWSSYKFTESKISVLSVLFLSILSYFLSHLFMEQTILDRTYALSHDESTNARLMLWSSSIKMLLDHPLVGTGWGTWNSFYPAYRMDAERTTAGYFAHNDYLQLADEGGLIATVLFGALFFFVMVLIKRNIKFEAKSVKFEALMLLFGVLAVFIHAGVNFIFNFTFINIVIGLYLARVSQLVDRNVNFHINTLSEIRGKIKAIFAFIALATLFTPYFLYSISISCLYGEQVGLKIINKIAPKITAFDVATVITFVRPKENLAQDFLLTHAEYFLSDNSKTLVSKTLRLKLFNDAIERFDLMRKYSANKPNTGVREVNLLLANQALWAKGLAYKKAHQIIDSNMKADPFHAKSIITLAKLYSAEGERNKAFNVLEQLMPKVIRRSEQQLIEVERLMLVTQSEGLQELHKIQQELEVNIAESNAGKTMPENFNQDIDSKLRYFK